jgi:hypothetical protein
MTDMTARPTAWRAAIIVDASMVVMMVVPTDADHNTWAVAIVVVIAVVIVLVCVAAVATAVAPIAVIVNVLQLRGSGTDALVHAKR